MSNLRSSKFVPEVKHAFDLKAIRQTRQSVNSLLNSQVVYTDKAQGRFIHSDSNMVLELPTPVESPVMFPFKIYQIDNRIDKSLNKYTFQIRSGLIGFRSAYKIPEDGASLSSVTTYCYTANWEMPLIGTGTDNVNWNAYQYLLSGSAIDFSAPPTVNGGGSVDLDPAGAPTLICENYPGSSFPFDGVQITISAAAIEPVSAVFWIKVLDDAVLGPYTQLWGKVNFQEGLTTEFSYPSISDGSELVLIGSVTYGGNISGFNNPNGVVCQSQCGNLLNRYLQLAPILTGTPFRGVPQVFRGKVSGIPVSSTVGSVNYRIYFPGDIVIDDATTSYFANSGAGGVAYHPSYIFCETFMDEMHAFTGVGGKFLPYGFNAVQ